MDLLEKNIPIYILQYPTEKKSFLNLSNFKVIGIHKGAMKKFKLNCGSPIKDIINKFNREYKSNKKNIKDKAPLKIKHEKNKSCNEQKLKKIKINNFINKQENETFIIFLLKKIL